ncbi:MAG: NADH-quinone oxidoreductase subunit NuoK [Actinobacteria bacterium]|nr:NADH-quinone oxidoreductase subunit NuoK [Actinomycetota bacterium]
MMLRLEYFLIISAALFCIGVFGVLSRRHVIQLLLSIELILNAVIINFVAFSAFMPTAKLTGQVFAIFIITIAAAEVGVGLAVIISIYRNIKTAKIEDMNILKW